MDVNTGKVFSVKEMEKMFGDTWPSNFITVDESDMTDEQKKEKRVSLKDHKSKLGKKLTSARFQRKRFFE